MNEIESALTQMSEHVRALHDELGEGILVADDRGERFLRANPAICRMLGYSEAELLSLGVRDIHPPESLPHVLEVFEAMRQGRLKSAPGLPCLRKDGELVYANVTAIPIMFQGRPCVLGLFYDVTQERLAAEALKKEQRLLRQMLELQERERRLVAYEIHDGFAQQLTGALFRLQAFRETLARDPSRAWQEFDSSARMLARAIDETRRLISGLRPPILDELGIVEAIEYLVCERRLEGGLEIEFDHDVACPRLPPSLQNTIFRIVQELFNNACRHSRSPRVRVTLREHDGRIYASIRDWGVGFSPDGVPKQRFGLQGVRERVRLLQGRVTIDSAPNEGTEVSVELPLNTGETTLAT